MPSGQSAGLTVRKRPLTMSVTFCHSAAAAVFVFANSLCIDIPSRRSFTDACSLSYVQLYVVLAGILQSVDIELFEPTRERDIEIKGGGSLGEPTRKMNGMRVLVKGVVS